MDYKKNERATVLTDIKGNNSQAKGLLPLQYHDTLTSRSRIRSSGVENNFRDLSIFDGGTVVVARGVGELEGHFAAGGAVDGDLSQTLRAVVGVTALHET